MGETFKWVGGEDVPEKPQDFDFAKKFWDLATNLLESKQFVVHPIEAGSNSLAGVLDGLNKLKDGKVSAAKLVYRIDGTA